MKLLLVLLFLSLSACAIGPTRPAMVKYFSDPNNRTSAEVTMDRFKCGADGNGYVYNEYMNVYNACMETRGYVLKERPE